MCFGGGSSSAADQARASEDRARQEAADREARILEGQGKIDAAFARYDTPYYDRYASSIESARRPQLDDQYKDASSTAVLSLADRGMLDSTFGAQSIGKIGEVYRDNAARIANEAKDSALSLRGKVEGQKSDLYALNRSAADPKGINAQAIGAATALAAPSATSPIGAVFEGALAPFLYFNSARQNSPGLPYRSPVSVATGAGTSRNVG